MKVFFIKGKQYVSTSTTGNYTKIVNQLIADHGSGFVYFKGGSKLKIGFSVFNDIDLSFPRTLTVPYRQLLKGYMTADDVMRLIDFTPAELQPQADGKFKYFTDVVKLEGEPNWYYSIKDVTQMYWNMIANEVKKHGFKSNYEFPEKVGIEVTSKNLKINIKYKIKDNEKR